MKLKKGTPMTMDADDRSTFNEWLAQVDRYCWKAASVSIHDLPDQPFRDWYDDRIRASRAAQRAIRAAGFDE